MDARTLIAERQRRADYFPGELFADPAWDMLLDLTANEGRRISVTSLCIASCVPMTTALRWIGLLEREGLIRRADDPLDGRRVFVSLTETAREAMRGYLTTNALAREDTCPRNRADAGHSFHAKGLSRG